MSKNSRKINDLTLKELNEIYKKFNHIKDWEEFMYMLETIQEKLGEITYD